MSNAAAMPDRNPIYRSCASNQAPFAVRRPSKLVLGIHVAPVAATAVCQNAIGAICSRPMTASAVAPSSPAIGVGRDCLAVLESRLQG